MSIERARAYFKNFDMEDRILEFDVSSATVELAAQALSCEPARIAKSLSFKIDDRTLLILAAGDAKIDNKNIKQPSVQRQKCCHRTRSSSASDMPSAGSALLESMTASKSIWMIP